MPSVASVPRGAVVAAEDFTQKQAHRREAKANRKTNQVDFKEVHNKGVAFEGRSTDCTRVRKEERKWEDFSQKTETRGV
jgi:hypothetical protein